MDEKFWVLAARSLGQSGKNWQQVRDFAMQSPESYAKMIDNVRKTSAPEASPEQFTNFVNTQYFGGTDPMLAQQQVAEGEALGSVLGAGMTAAGIPKAGQTMVKAALTPMIFGISSGVMTQLGAAQSDDQSMGRMGIPYSASKPLSSSHLERLKATVGEEKAWDVFGKEAKSLGFKDIPAYFDFQKEEKAALLQSRQEAIKVAQGLQRRGEGLESGTVRSMQDIEEPLDVVEYVFGAMGQAAGQIPAAVATYGASAYLQELGEIHLSQLEKLSQDTGLSIDQVMEKGLDDGSASALYSISAALLERVGAGKVLKPISNKMFKAGLRKKAVHAFFQGASTEFLTEGVQTMIEDFGSSQSAGRTAQQSFDDINWEGVLEASVQGAIGGGGISSVSGTSQILSPEEQATQEQATSIIEQYKQQQANDTRNKVANTWRKVLTEEEGKAINDATSEIDESTAAVLDDAFVVAADAIVDEKLTPTQIVTAEEKAAEKTVKQEEKAQQKEFTRLQKENEKLKARQLKTDEQATAKKEVTTQLKETRKVLNQQWTDVKNKIKTEAEVDNATRSEFTRIQRELDDTNRKLGLKAPTAPKGIIQKVGGKVKTVAAKAKAAKVVDEDAVNEKNNDTLGSTITKLNLPVEAEPKITDSLERRIYTYRREGDSSFSIIFDKNAKGELIKKGVKVEGIKKVAKQPAVYTEGLEKLEGLPKNRKRVKEALNNRNLDPKVQKELEDWISNYDTTVKPTLDKQRSKNLSKKSKQPTKEYSPEEQKAAQDTATKNIEDIVFGIKDTWKETSKSRSGEVIDIENTGRKQAVKDLLKLGYSQADKALTKLGLAPAKQNMIRRELDRLHSVGLMETPSKGKVYNHYIVDKNGDLVAGAETLWSNSPKKRVSLEAWAKSKGYEYKIYDRSTNTVLQGTEEQAETTPSTKKAKPPVTEEDVKGASLVFTSTPRLVKIGSKEDYLAYVQSIFPKSLDNSIYYHASAFTLDEGFQFKQHRLTFFTKDREYTKSFGKHGAVAPNLEGFLYPVVLDIRNPLVAKDKISDGSTEAISSIKAGEFDSLQGVEYGTADVASIGVYKPEQIHILGSEQDIEGFTKYKAQSTKISVS